MKKSLILATVLAVLSSSAFAFGGLGPCTDQSGKPLDAKACAFNASQRGQVTPDGSPAFMRLYRGTAYGN